MNRREALYASAAIPFLVPAQAKADTVPGDLHKYLAGLQPLRISKTQISVQGGSCEVRSGSAGPYGLFTRTTTTTLDITNPANIDNGTPPRGEEWFYLWVRSDGRSGDIVYSRAELQGQLTNPYGMQRKLGYAIRWTGSALARVVMTGWPTPILLYTETDLGSGQRILSQGTATTWTDVSCLPYQAPSSRTVRLLCDLCDPGSAYVRTPGVGSGIPVGNTSIANPCHRMMVDLPTSSDNRVQYITHGGRLSLHVAAYGIDETY